MAARDFYAVLGIERGASLVDVKRAFRRLAHQHHPDHNAGDREAEELFKEINAAFEVLGDPDRRRNYDLELGDLVGDVDLGDDEPAPPGVEHSCKAAVTFWAAVLGDKVELVTPMGHRVELRLPVGTRDGQQLRLRGKGGPGSPPGDLIVTLEVQPDKVYCRGDGDTLQRNLEVTWLEAWRGDFLEVETPWGSTGLELRAGSRDGQLYEVSGHGVRRPGGIEGKLQLRLVLRPPPSPAKLAGDVALALADALRAAYDSR